MASDELLYRVIIVGDTGVGKSCFLLRFTENRFKDQHNVTIGVEFGAKMLQVDGHSVKLQIWDTAGQESFRSITRSFYRKADGVLLMYDVMDKTSFENCSFWITEIQENAEVGIVIYLVGNQVDAETSDRRREVSFEDAEKLTNKFHLGGHKETSAKTGANVDATFLEFSRVLMERHRTTPVNPPSPKVSLKRSAESSQSSERKSKCC